MLLTLVSPIGLCDEESTTIRDLSSILRVDLLSRKSAARPGENIALVATLKNLSADRVGVVPLRLFGYVNYSVDPHCSGVSGLTGQMIAEGSGPVDRDAAVLKPGESVSLPGSVIAPALDDCANGGTYLISVEYYQFLSGVVSGLALLEGCVASNTIAIEIPPSGVKR
jgi:hypothetical protein